MESVSTHMPSLRPELMRLEYDQKDVRMVDGEKGVCSGSQENLEDMIETPKVGMMFDSIEEAYMYYSRFAKQEGFVAIKRTSKKGAGGKRSYSGFACSRSRKAKVGTSNSVKPRPQSRIGCPAHINMVLQHDGKWMITRIVLDHNHEQSSSKIKYLKCNRVIDDRTKKGLELHSEVGRKVNKTYDSLDIDVGGSDNLLFSQRDCQNQLNKHRWSLLMDGDTEAMQNYFIMMTKDNSDFFHLMDLDNDGRLRNVLWADARSRAAVVEFGDVITFDTRYLVNRYNMPFVSFLGVNHHGQSILLGCGLIFHEDAESFSWIFKTWKSCMWDYTPKAIITDQCMVMKNAIENVFPRIQHRWCIWRIMKKIPKKLGGHNAYESLSGCMHQIVHNSVTIEQFDRDWDLFIKEYDLQANSWLEVLFEERRRWVPAYVKDWVGMSSTERSEGIKAYFDGYIYPKTTLKQFLGQYENALAKKVQSENQADAKSWSSFIPLIQQEDEVEKQFQSIYTHAKVKEFQTEFVGKLKCTYLKIKEGEHLSKYEVKEWIIFGEGGEKMKKQVTFIVDFHVETSETFCTCQLFEFRGMVCKHQLLVWFDMGIEKVPDKYVLKRWCKNVKRAHTKVRIGYDSSSRSVESLRYDNMCNMFKEVADLAEDSLDRYEMVMTRVCVLKQELVEIQFQSGSSTGSKTCNDSVSLGDGVSKI